MHEKTIRPETATDKGIVEPVAPELDFQEGPARPPAENSALLGRLLDEGVLLTEDWDALPASRRQAIEYCPDTDSLLELLVAEGLLTDYQTARIKAGSTFGLVLGNYRVLDRLGKGGMGVVFRAEHRRLRRPVAVK